MNYRQGRRNPPNKNVKGEEAYLQFGKQIKKKSIKKTNHFIHFHFFSDNNKHIEYFSSQRQDFFSDRRLLKI